MADRDLSRSTVAHPEGAPEDRVLRTSSSSVLRPPCLRTGKPRVAASVASMRLPASRVGAVLFACLQRAAAAVPVGHLHTQRGHRKTSGASGKRELPQRHGCHLPVSVSDAENIRASLYDHVEKPKLTSRQSLAHSSGHARGPSPSLPPLCEDSGSDGASRRVRQVTPADGEECLPVPFPIGPSHPAGGFGSDPSGGSTAAPAPCRRGRALYGNGAANGGKFRSLCPEVCRSARYGQARCTPLLRFGPKGNRGYAGRQE